jgi:hypothetical protein
MKKLECYYIYTFIPYMYAGKSAAKLAEEKLKKKK